MEGHWCSDVTKVGPVKLVFSKNAPKVEVRSRASGRRSFSRLVDRLQEQKTDISQCHEANRS